MDYYWGLLIWAGIVVVSMLIVIVLAQRWGRDPFGFALLAAVVGPIAIIALIGTRSADRKAPHTFEGGAAPAASRRQPVLVAVDGSESAKRAADAVVRLNDQRAEVVVLTVLPREAQARATGSPPQVQEHQREIDRLTRDALDALRSAGMQTRVVVGYGVPGEEIVEGAAEENAEIIVVGRRGAGLSKALLGSSSNYVVEHAGVPVVVVD
jgi:nucleotide-binding universal stress UspA family protein